MRRAVFFDRDGTLIELVHYLVDPDQVAVLPGVPEALRELRAADYYFCPVKPEQDDRTRVEHADRKPGPGMLLRAARDLDLDLTASWMIGDSVSDLLAGRNAGCRGSILVRTGYGASTEDEDHGADHVVDDVKQAAELILRLDRTWSAPRGAREGSTR
jgi:D-glycero-D-manno-heptose 1,7-bisphosphate phosphatase